jgi:uncharacterized repeat protein (TIGR02543 family)
MKTMKTFLFGAGLLLIPWQGFAQSPQTVYDGTASLPTAQGWTQLLLDNTVSSAATATSASVSGVLRLQSTNATDQFSQLGWYKQSLSLDPAVGYTIEIKAKITAADKTGAFNLQGFDVTGKGFRVGILKTAITALTNPLDATTTVASGLINDDGFHTYKLAVTATTVAVFRDGTLAGTFPLSAFQWDNIIENGGFEDAGHPDFLTTGGLLSQTTTPAEVKSGSQALIMNSNGKVTTDWTDIEGARTREIAIKPNTQYEMSITRRSINDPRAWRDMGAFYDNQDGTLGLKGNNRDGRDDAGRPMFASVNDGFWQIHNQTFTTPASGSAAIRFEFPSWVKDGQKTVISAFDNFVFREKPSIVVGPTTAPETFSAPVIPGGITNLIKNGDFEDPLMNNDGTSYKWSLASENSGNDANEPVADNPMWGNNVQLRDKDKTGDNVTSDGGYAHSGSHSVRFSSLSDNAKNIDFRVELEADKTYRFVFWHRNPGYCDWAWLFVRIGEQAPFWGHKLGCHLNKWIPVDLTFTTTAEHKTLHLYSTSATHGVWWNQYFDDFTLYEVTGDIDPQIAGKTNLIENGGFEDVTMNNNGETYYWAKASDVSGYNDDLPMAYNDLWGAYIRIQDREKRAGNYPNDWNVDDDTGLQWAHSGAKSLRISTVADARGDVPCKQNINFRKELEPNKTYTFVFWFKKAHWDEDGGGGKFYVANGSVNLLAQPGTNKYLNWTRQSVTFSTTENNHTLRIYTDFTNWFNYYLDDLFLFEEDTYVAPSYNGDSYLFFGKSTGDSSTDVEVEYVKVDNAGAYINVVEFNSNGGSDVATQIVSGTATLPTPPAKTGYTFAGWYSDLALTTSYYFESPVSSNLTLYAKWNVQSFVVTYDVDGGSAVGSETVEYNKKATKPTDPTKASHVFMGWYADDLFTTPFDFDAPITEAVTVHAQWMPKELVLHLAFEDNLNDQTSYTRNPTAPSGNDYVEGPIGKALSLNQANRTVAGTQYLDWSHPSVINPSNTPHTYSMWYYNNSEIADATNDKEEILIQQKDNSGTGRIGIGTNYTTVTPEGAHIFSFYGNSRLQVSNGSFERNKWTHVVMTADPATQTVVFYINGVQAASLVSANAFESNIGGFVIGKHKNAQGWWHGYIDDLRLYKGVLEPSVVADLYALREQKIVTFDSNGGTAVTSRTIAKLETAAEPTAPKRAGYTFDGWYDVTLTTAYDFAAPVTGDLTLYAKWTTDPSYKETFFIDFGQDNPDAHMHLTTGVDVNGNVWNNAIAPNGTYSTLTAPYSISTLVNAQGANTAASLTVKRTIYSNGGGNGGLYTPDPAYLGDLAIETATEDYFFLLNNEDGKFSITGLDPTKAYKFTIFGTRINSGSNTGRGAIYSLYGATGSHGTLVNADNSQNVWVSSPVKPSASGEILLALGRLNDGEMAYIGAMKFEEVTDVIPVVDRTFYIDFGRNDGSQGVLTTDADANGNYWTNVYSNGGEMRPVYVNPVTLADSDNATTADYKLSIAEPGGNNPQFNGLVNGGLANPSAALLGDIAIETATRDYIFTDGAPIEMTFSRLKTSNQFRFNIFGSRSQSSGTDERVHRIKLEGSNTVIGIHQTTGAGIGDGGANANNNRIFVSDLITPDASDNIKLTLSRWLGMAHINVIKLEEIGDASTGLSSNSLTGLRVSSANGNLTVQVDQPSVVSVYNATGSLVAAVKVESSKTLSLPIGVYLVKAISASGEVGTAKALNK